ncbi:MAG: tRNA adenosine(34) deaminase TadA [Candidatus Caldatribacterium sp.]|uniref:tRNA adenosine(34) deaminase TadA n=1 Tax=Candidatus Caldatribacterium sp. TaxID=2282143 RepID=UPI002998AF53|nr:tRNA adenosine(34) deaminase TadA [Candidatus Caldatribacterium sp.]MCX7731344.1 tRNA adenosine(34) deaminase TadA [Candidatus Caldatribacterium sp.]MDW8081890.1 tRNA adenosine(34) deaminase TadA [Candidatus Calescibacterium sp.]
MRDEFFMHLALEEAKRAFAEDEVPVGACIVRGDAVVALGRNRREKMDDVTAHAEIEAIRKAQRVLGDWRLEGCTLYVTLEPCLMCAGAIIQARIARLVFGAFDPKAGVAGSVLDVFLPGLFPHTVSVTGGVLAEECGAILREYFRRKR